MGPAGFVSIDDSEVMKILAGRRPGLPRRHRVLEIGRRDWHDEDHIVTEATIRAFFDYCRKVIEL